MTQQELDLIADVLAWTTGATCLCDESLRPATRKHIREQAAECAADLAKHCEDRA